MTRISPSDQSIAVVSNPALRVLDIARTSAETSRHIACSTRIGARHSNARATKGRTSSARRRGQALLVSVLLMIFAAVLGAAFVTVVALNLSQTARSSSINTARQAANSGLQFVNDQLTNSIKGENWRPTDVTLASATGDTYYYSDFERAQGWDQNDAAGIRFAKFPDPRSTSITGNNTPTYLTKVERVTDATSDRYNQLKVTIIGRASDDDAAASTLTFYKPTTQNGNVTSFARYDSSWSFRTNKLVKTAALSPPLLPSNDTALVANPQDFSPGQTILIGYADNAPAMRVAVISSIVGNQLNLAAVDSGGSIPPVAAGTPVRLASTYIGGLLEIDAVGAEPNPPTPLQGTNTPLEYDNPLLPSPPLNGGIMANNGMNFQGKSQFGLNTTSARPDQVRSGGPISITGSAIANITNRTDTEDIKTTTNLTPFVRYQKSEADDPTDPNQGVKPLTPARLDTPDSRWLQKTKLTGDAGAQYGFGEGLYIDNPEDTEKVGYSTGMGVYGYGRTSWRPLTISDTQRLLTRKSFPIKSFVAPSSETGNVDTSATLVASTADPTKAEYADGASAHRLIYPRIGLNPVAPQPYSFPIQPGSDTSAPALMKDPSLEERGLRGWVSSTEFLPRGVLIELQGDKIIVTRDDLSDHSRWVRDANGDILNNSGVPATDASVAPATTNALQFDPKYNQPDYNKAWKDQNGNPVLPIVATSSNTNGFRMVLRMDGTRLFGAPGLEVASGPPLPVNGFNGVIYADGNVRLRGFTNASTKDLTIVSMGNIYVEGGINQLDTSLVHKGNVALLAKKNVILNPTQIMARVEGAQSAAIVANVRVDGAAGATVAVPVTTTQVTTTTFPNDFNKLRIGDKFRFVGDSVWHMVTQLDTATSTVSFTPSYTTGAPLVAKPLDVLAYSDGISPRIWRLNRGSSDIIARDVKFDGANLSTAQNFAFDMLHQGIPVPGANQFGAIFNRQAGTLTPGTINVSAASAGATKTLTLTPNGAPPVTTDLLGGIPVPTAPGAALPPAPVANSLGALVWQFYNDDGGTTPPAGVTAVNAADANNGNRDRVGVPGTIISSGTAAVVQIYEEGDQNPDWDLFVLPNARNLAARRFVNTTTAKTATPLTPVDALTTPNGMPALDSSGANGGGILMAVSVGLYKTDPLLSFSTAPVNTVGSSFGLPNVERYPETDDIFYQGNNLRSTVLFGTNATLNPTGSNVAAFRRDLAPDGASDTLPNYRVQSYKLDRIDLAEVVSNPINITVQATIYAQDGSWFVIPVPAFTPRPAIPAAPTATEVDEANRFRRYNYKFTIQANIAENFAPTGLFDYDNEQTPDQDSSTPLATPGRGTQAQWLDASAYPTDTAGSTWQTINYVAPTPLLPGNTLYLPMTPDISIER